MPVSKTMFTFIATLVISNTASAHTVVTDASEASAINMFWKYLQLGFEHIIPSGLDHILFVLSLFLLKPSLKPIIIQSTIFTIAHSISLAISMYGIISPPSSIVEPVIALSIVWIAAENLRNTHLGKVRLTVIFLFGLIHGLGFASSLKETGLAEDDFALSLLAFNVGVETGQLSVILLVYLLVGIWFGQKSYYRKNILIPTSAMIMIVAGYWTIERMV